MSEKLNISVEDKSTVVITAIFTDEDGVSVVPNWIKWTLTNQEGTIINSRNQVVMSPAASVDIILSGADINFTEGHRRLVAIESEYDSSIGNDLPLTGQAEFGIENIKIIA